MTDPTLATAERHVRGIASGDRHYLTFVHAHLNTVLAEYDRRGAELAAVGPVVEAARAYIAHLDAATTRDGRWFERNQKHLDVLAARVRAHTDTTTEKD